MFRALKRSQEIVADALVRLCHRDEEGGCQNPNARTKTRKKNENNIMHKGNPKKDDTACIVRVV